MWSVNIHFELHLESVLETSSVLAILFETAILLVMWRYRRFLNSLVNELCGALDRFRDRKPVPEENEDNQVNKV